MIDEGMKEGGGRIREGLEQAVTEIPNDVPPGQITQAHLWVGYRLHYTTTPAYGVTVVLHRYAGYMETCNHHHHTC